MRRVGAFICLTVASLTYAGDGPVTLDFRGPLINTDQPVPTGTGVSWPATVRGTITYDPGVLDQGGGVFPQDIASGVTVTFGTNPTLVYTLDSILMTEGRARQLVCWPGILPPYDPCRWIPAEAPALEVSASSDTQTVTIHLKTTKTTPGRVPLSFLPQILDWESGSGRVEQLTFAAEQRWTIASLVYSCTAGGLAGRYSGVAAGRFLPDAPFSSYLFAALTANHEIAVFSYLGQRGSPGQERSATGTYEIVDSSSCVLVVALDDATSLVARALLPPAPELIMFSSPFDAKVQQSGFLFREQF